MNNHGVLDQVQLRERLRAFKEQRGAEFALTALGYFGSYARGEATSESDVDVVFQTEHPNLLATSGLRQDLEAWLERPVDVVRLHEYQRPAFRARIEREAIYV